MNPPSIISIIIFTSFLLIIFLILVALIGKTNKRIATNLQNIPTTSTKKILSYILQDSSHRFLQEEKDLIMKTILDREKE